MITMKELIHCGKDPDTVNPKKMDQLNDLLIKINKIRVLWDNPMIVSSGLRTWEDHLRIYKEKGIADLNKIPKASNHLETVINGAAVDIRDKTGEFKQWILDNVKLFEDLGLYMEDFSSTDGWVHIQNVPPASGKRFFKP